MTKTSRGVYAVVRFVDYPMPLTRPQDPFGRVDLNRQIGEKQRAYVRDDRFEAGGVELRLFGANLGTPPIDHRGPFEFLASIGVNFVRCGASYREWGADGSTKVPDPAPVELPARTFERLCRQVRICEETGIYLLLHDLALGLGPPYYPAEDADRFAQWGRRDASVLGLWHPGVRELVMKRLKWMLGARNPYTRQPFGASPALLGIQLTNEMGWFAADPHLRTADRWAKLTAAPARVTALLAEQAGLDVSRFKRLDSEERLVFLAQATAQAYREAREIMERELGRSRPLLVADSAPSAGGLAFQAFGLCDAYGWNLYPSGAVDPAERNPVKPHDLRSEPFLDRMQARLAGKPTVITETGDGLAAGGYSRLIAEMTVRASVYGYAGVAFHAMYRGIYGDRSTEPDYLESRTPRNNYELGLDPGALCALQACSLIFRRGLIKGAPRTLTITRRTAEYARSVVERVRQLEDLHLLSSDLEERARRRKGALNTCIKLREGRRRFEERVDSQNEDRVERGHVRAAGAEMDWGTMPRPEEDWLFIRAPLRKDADLLVLVGRSKPDPAEQLFDSGSARLSGFRKHPWPDHRTGYGTHLLVRRPAGPGVRIEGELYHVGESGRRGDRIPIDDPSRFWLPQDGIRFVELA